MQEKDGRISMHAAEIVLDALSIDQASERAADILDQSDFSHRSALSARLAFEAALLNLQGHFGEEAPALLVEGKRFGRPFLQVRVEGERFDPREEFAGTDWERSLMEVSGIRPTYAYRGGYNIVGLACPIRVSSMEQSAIAIALGVVLGFAGRFLPAEVRTSVLDGLIMPLFNTFIGMLSGIAVPLMFLSVAGGICGIGDMVALGRNGKAVVGRLLRADVVAVAAACAVAIPLFPLSMGTSTSVSELLYSLVGILLELLPTNIMSPFLEGNTLQIVTLSVAMGVAALALGDATAQLRMALRQLTLVVEFLMVQLCRLLPGFIVVMMVSQSWSGSSNAILSSWLPIVLIASLAVLFLATQLVTTSVKYHLPLRELVTSIFPALVLAFTTASASATFGIVRSTCEDEMGIDQGLSSFGVPLGLVLSRPATAMFMVVTMLYSAQTYGVSASLVWYLRLVLCCLLYAIAVPPVPGGALACYGMLLAGLGIPVEAMAVVTALDFLLDNFNIAGNVGAIIVEMISAADALGAREKG